MAAILDGGRTHPRRFVRGFLLVLVLAVAVAVAVAAARDQARTPAPDGFALTEPRPGVFVHLGRQLALDAPGHDDIANLGFIVGSRCIAVIDTGGSVRIGRALRAAVQSRSRLPICFVIDTHVHVDHVLGNAAFAADRPQFVGHVHLGQAMAQSRGYFLREYPEDFDGTPGVAQVIGPDRLIERESTLDLGDRLLRLRAWPTAHTDCDLTVYDVRTRTLWTGDLLFRERLPALDGSLKGWLAVIDRLAGLKAALVVPGHGTPTQDLEGSLARERGYLRALYAGVRRELERGESLQHALASVAADERGRWLLWDQVHPRNVIRAYEELQWE